MTNRLLSVLLASGSIMSFSAVAAYAQIDEIVTTATKRTESVQDVPLSVTAFSQEDLDIRGATNLEGIQESTPNLNFSAQSADSNVARVTLRGVGTETLVGGGDPGVALHIDGVYVGRNSAAISDIFDVQRVEVLRGPQGTLYGRNATGGSVNIITNRPTDVSEGYADITYGNYNEFRVRGVANVPLTENLSSRVSIFSESHDGFVENLYEPGRDNSDKNVQGGRLQLLWETDSGNEILLKGYFSRAGGAGGGARYLGDDITTANGYPARYLIGVSDGSGPPIGAPIQGDAYNLGTAADGSGILPRPTGFHQVRKDAPEFVDTVIKGVDLEASFNVSDNILLKSISSYQTNDNEILVDSDGSELDIQTRARRTDAKQFSQEFNLISQTDDPLQWILGAYYYHEELNERFQTATPAGVIPGSTGIGQLRITDHEVDSVALFAQLSYDLTDKLSVTGGIRHTWDEKNQSRDTGGNVDATNGLRLRGGGALGPLAPDSGEASFSELSYRVSADYKVGDDSLLFASYARGYKSGGFDFNGGRIDGAGEQLPYNPEFVDAIEVGLKNKFFDNRALLNLTAFHYDYKDLQVFRLTADGPLTDNAAQSTIKGVEAEAKFELSENFQIDGSVGYLDATYDEYTIDIPPTDFSGNRLNYAPEWTTALGATYTANLENADLIFRADWSYRSDIFFDRANTELDTQEAYSLLNGRIRYDAEAYYFDLWGRNLGDEEYVTGQLINPPAACGCRTVNLGAPRTYGVTLGTRW